MAWADFFDPGLSVVNGIRYYIWVPIDQLEDVV